MLDFSTFHLKNLVKWLFHTLNYFQESCDLICFVIICKITINPKRKCYHKGRDKGNYLMLIQLSLTNNKHHGSYRKSQNQHKITELNEILPVNKLLLINWPCFIEKAEIIVIVMMRQ